MGPKPFGFSTAMFISGLYSFFLFFLTALPSPVGQSVSHAKEAGYLAMQLDDGWGTSGCV